MTSSSSISELQQLLTRLARARAGAQIGTHAGVTYFRSLARSTRGGATYVVQDLAARDAVALESAIATERRFIMPNECYWSYVFPATEAPVADASTFERQLAAATYVARGHALDPR